MDHDPTIPRRGPGITTRTRMHQVAGYFAFTGVGRSGEVVLVSRDRGMTWPLHQVSIEQGLWSSADGSEGLSKLPRPEERDAEGNRTLDGDPVLISFVEGDPAKPLVRPGVRSVTTSDFLPYNHDTPGADPNRLHARLAPRNAAGEVVGNVDLEVCETGTPSITLRVKQGSSTTVIEITPNAVEVRTGGQALTLQAGQGRALKLEGGVAGVATLGDTSGGEKVLHGETILQELLPLLTGFWTFVSSCSTATTAGQVATAAGTFLGVLGAAPAGTLGAKILVSQAAGAPLLSTKTKVV